MRVDLRAKDIETLCAVFRRFPAVHSVRVFGSRATGDARRASDIDLAVFAPEMTDSEWSELRDALDEAPLIYNMDIVRMETLSQDKLRKRIDADGVVIFER